MADTQVARQESELRPAWALGRRITRRYRSRLPTKRTLLVAAALPFVTLAGCAGNNDSADTSAATTTEVAVTTAAPTTTTTTEVPTTTTTEVTTTTEPESDFPTYTEYLATLPPGTETCDTRGEVSEIGGGIFSVGGPDSQISMRDGQLVLFCPGAKLVVGEPFTGLNQNGEPLEKGALFSVSPDGSFVQLSSF